MLGCYIGICTVALITLLCILWLTMSHCNHGKALDKMRADVDLTMGRMDMFLKSLKVVEDSPKKRGRKKKDEV